MWIITSILIYHLSICASFGKMMFQPPKIEPSLDLVVGFNLPERMVPVGPWDEPAMTCCWLSWNYIRQRFQTPQSHNDIMFCEDAQEIQEYEHRLLDSWSWTSASSCQLRNQRFNAGVNKNDRCPQGQSSWDQSLTTWSEEVMWDALRSRIVDMARCCKHL